MSFVWIRLILIAQSNTDGQVWLDFVVVLNEAAVVEAHPIMVAVPKLAGLRIIRVRPCLALRGVGNKLENIVEVESRPRVPVSERRKVLIFENLEARLDGVLSLADADDVSPVQVGLCKLDGSKAGIAKRRQGTWVNLWNGTDLAIDG